YLRQVMATVNFESKPPYNIVYGAINTHIEHHLYPDLPPNRLREVAPTVKQICERYGVPYRTGGFIEQVFGVLANGAYRSLPLKPQDQGDILSLIKNPPELLGRLKEGFIGML